ncbi:MAG: hypothetical protein ACYS0G_01645 [Planctomycetota bacterium]|jgi:hypothetical protein
MAFPLLCHRCAAELIPGEASFYVVRIEAFADPTPPSLSLDEPLTEISAEIDRLIERARDMSEQELMDQVYRRLTLFLCIPCYQNWIERPAG